MLLFRWNLNASIKVFKIICVWYNIEISQKLCHDFNYLRIKKVSQGDTINFSSEHSAGLELVVVQGGSEPSLDPQTLPPPVLTDLLNDDKVTKQYVQLTHIFVFCQCILGS